MNYDVVDGKVNTDIVRMIKDQVFSDINFHVCLCLKHIIKGITCNYMTFDYLNSCTEILSHLMSYLEQYNIKMSPKSNCIILYLSSIFRENYKIKKRYSFIYWLQISKWKSWSLHITTTATCEPPHFHKLYKYLAEIKLSNYSKSNLLNLLKIDKQSYNTLYL